MVDVPPAPLSTVADATLLEQTVIRVLLTHTYPIVLHGLQALLQAQQQFQVVDRRMTAQGLMEAVRRHRPDILLMDWQLKDG
ncbi:two component system sensor kinase SsrB [Thiorhodovibrio winogradskyi]|uniref:Two component system sensor kinase SsrB n=1 Tax=Thiorhodovibrio winogradskyi TaxID=77007 RepID=A0ABZ0S4Y5_9GAMM|nr:hypothetical protein [Thiorhodovibrio winogradskyi]